MSDNKFKMDVDTQQAVIDKEYIHPQSRSYQLEMLEESMKQNVIVAVNSRKVRLVLYSMLRHRFRWTQEAAKHTCRWKA